MAKILNIPTDSPYQASDADIGTITGVLPVLYAINIDISAVKQILGGNNCDLNSLCSHVNINKWALFRPGGFTNINPLTGSYPITLPSGGVNSPYSLGDFAGYNHSAKPPTYFEYVNDENPVIEEYDELHISCRINKGERLPIPSTASWADIMVYFLDDGDNVLQEETVSISELGSNLVGGIFTPSGIGNKTYKIKACYNSGTYYNSIIEDGIKNINVTISQLMITGTISNEDLVNSTSLYCNVSMTRTTNSPKNLYYRLVVFMGFQLDGTYNFGRVDLLENETRSFTNVKLDLSGSGTSIAQTVALNLEVSISSDFSTSRVIATGEFEIIN